MSHSIRRASATETGAAFPTISSASARAAPSSSSPGCTDRTSPPSSASAAVNTRPVVTHSIAREMPTMRGRNHDEHASGTIPRRANTNPSLASSATNRTSIGRVIVTPTPTAGPLIAAKTGLSDEKIRSDTVPPVSRGTASSVCTSRQSNVSPPPPRSAPAQNARPAPVTMTARTSSSASEASNASMSSRPISAVNAFRRSGRLSVMVRTPSATSEVIVSKSMGGIVVHTVAMRRRHSRLGYALAASAATMWALNGSLSRLLLDDGVSALRLGELRGVLSFVMLAAALAIARPRLLRVRRQDIPRLAFLGVVGLAGVHATYFFAISRLDVGVALVIQYLGPLILLLWLRLVHRRQLQRSLWGAAVLSVIGCFLVVQAWNPGAIDGLGLLAAFGAAVTFAIYLYSSEQAGHRYEPVTTLVWGFGFAVIGTLLPFVCIVAALRHVPASRAAVVATLEPVLAAIIAWPVLGQDLDVAQIAGGLIVVGAVVWVQIQRPAGEEEAAPAYRESTAAAVR